MTTLVATVEWIDSPLTPRIQWELNADPPRPRPGQEPPPFQFVVVNGADFDPTRTIDGGTFN